MLKHEAALNAHGLDDSRASPPELLELGNAALRFLKTVDGDLELLSALDDQLDGALMLPLLDAPRRLSVASEVELAVELARALAFCARDDMHGEIAAAYARAGRREDALAQVDSNLETAELPFLAEARAGDVYQLLGDTDSAEAYFRRSLAVAGDGSEKRQAALRIANLLIDQGREAEASALLAAEHVDR